jgi:uncharacterized protein (TIGR03067 family)
VTRITTLACGLLATLIAAGDDPQPAALKPELLIGTWTLTAGVKDGVKWDKPEGDVTVTKDKIALKAEDGTVFEFGYKLDLKAKPVAIDLEILAPEGFKGAKAKGIIAVENNVTKLAYHPMMGDRPQNFNAKKETGEYMFEWTKKSEK